jgi:hypothetical protein
LMRSFLSSLISSRQIAFLLRKQTPSYAH